MKMENRQSDSSKTEPFASRLREERLRVEPHQGKFCDKIGVSRNRQSFLENGEREMRGDYLSLIAQHGLDVTYILTGRRGGEQLAMRESTLLSQFRSLDDIGQCTVLLTAAQMVSAAGQHFTPRHVIQAMVDDLTMSAQTGAGPAVSDPGAGAAGYLAGLHDQQRAFKGEE
ncbi:helix-turn-helix domain-containing protein [Sphingobium abikonense]|uniref:helix-turn-helix domain-containing protein n=1 Tax=Sphingobium abikonense TaxID=86193 RepID=UPI00351798D3